MNSNTALSNSPPIAITFYVILTKKILFVPLISYQALGLDDFQKKDFVTLAHMHVQTVHVQYVRKRTSACCARFTMVTSDLDWLQFCYGANWTYTLWRNCS